MPEIKLDRIKLFHRAIERLHKWLMKNYTGHENNIVCEALGYCLELLIKDMKGAYHDRG